ncbi:MAG: hypothetical protein JSS75_07050 [Bacteroidetes bacterium]|nr:hypothetical protein [Bacteroidota bacterium]
MRKSLRIFAFGILLGAVVGGCSSTTNTDNGSNGNGTVSYYGNKSTKVFHLPNCRYVGTGSNWITFSTRQEAINAGYTPDASGACNP